MSETRDVSDRGDELGRVLFERMTLIRHDFRDERLETWDEVSEMEREQFRDAALTVAFAAVGRDAA